MDRFGLPLVPSALALGDQLLDRFFLAQLADVAEVGLYSLGARIASAIVLLLTSPSALAWPRSRTRSRTTARRKPHVRVRAHVPALHRLLDLARARACSRRGSCGCSRRTRASTQAADAVAPLAFAQALYAGYIVLAIGVGRARQTQFNWVVTGTGALVNVALNLLLIPPYGMMGAAAASIAAFAVMFVGMTWRAQRVFPVPVPVAARGDARRRRRRPHRARRRARPAARRRDRARPRVPPAAAPARLLSPCRARAHRARRGTGRARPQLTRKTTRPGGGPGLCHLLGRSLELARVRAAARWLLSRRAGSLRWQ